MVTSIINSYSYAFNNSQCVLISKNPYQSVDAETPIVLKIITN